MPSAPNAEIRCVLIVGAGTMGQQIGRLVRHARL